MSTKQYIRPLMLGLLFVVVLALGGGSLSAQAPSSEEVQVEQTVSEEPSKSDSLATTTTPAPTKNARVEALKEQDPSGFVLTVTAVLVVFSALTLLFLVFKAVGRIFQAVEKPKGAVSNPITASRPTHTSKGGQGSGLSPEALVGVSMALHNFQQEQESEAMAAIAMALRSELEQSHDQESFVLTIARKPSLWNARALGMRQQH